MLRLKFFIQVLHSLNCEFIGITYAADKILFTRVSCEEVTLMTQFTVKLHFKFYKRVHVGNFIKLRYMQY